MDTIWKLIGCFKENGNKKNFHTVEISGTHDEERRLEEFDTQKTYRSQEKQKYQSNNLLLKNGRIVTRMDSKETNVV